MSLAIFKSRISLTPNGPALTISLDDKMEPHLELRTSSLLGARAKLADVPKLHALIEAQIRKVIKAKGSWTVVLPGLAHAANERETQGEKNADAKVELSAL